MLLYLYVGMFLGSIQLKQVILSVVLLFLVVENVLSGNLLLILYSLYEIQIGQYNIFLKWFLFDFNRIYVIWPHFQLYSTLATL